MAFQFASTNDPAPKKDIPKTSNVDPETWRRAEEAVRARNGGFSGVSEEGKRAQIQDAYDQIVESNDQAAKWEGKE
jgi:hypothetical protein